MPSLSSRAALAVMAAVALGSTAHAACGPAAMVAVKVGVREVPLTTQRNLSAADLRAMAAQLGRTAAHPVLGLYVGTVGYAVRDIEVAAQGGSRCPRVRVHADLVEVDRRIVVASDLSGAPCLLGAALDHYRRHSEAAHVALQELASALPGDLASAVDRYLRSRPAPPGESDRDLRAYVDGLLDSTIANFTASLAKVQAEVDTPDEVRKLTTPCGAT